MARWDEEMSLRKQSLARMWATDLLLNAVLDGALAMIAMMIAMYREERGKRGFKHFFHLPALGLAPAPAHHL